MFACCLTSFEEQLYFHVASLYDQFSTSLDLLGRLFARRAIFAKTYRQASISSGGSRASKIESFCLSVLYRLALYFASILACCFSGVGGASGGASGYRQMTIWEET